MTREEKSGPAPGGWGEAGADVTGLRNQNTTPTPVVVKAAEPNPDNISEALKKLPYWVLYQRREKGGKATPFGQLKQDKIPRQPRHPFAPASTAEAKHCGSFEEAREALRQCPQTDGLGLVLTHAWMDAPDLVALDFDGLRDPHTGEIAPDKLAGWETIKAVGSYTEVSPSGEGFRVFCFGSAGGAFNLGGVEAYPAGGAVRFVTVTGAHVEGFPREPRPVHNLAELLDPHRPAEKPEAGTGEDSGLPNTPPPIPEDVPERTALDLADGWLCFLEDCDQPPERFKRDRSRALQSFTTVLLAQGLEPPEVLGVLAHSDAFRVALEHRGQNEAKAMQYLWDGIRKAAARKPGAVAVAEDFPYLGAVEREERPDDRPTFPVVRLDDLESTEAPAPRHILSPYIPAGTVTLLGAHGGAGKSTLALHLAVCVALGRPFLGFPVERRPVLFFSAEDGADVVRWRLQQITRAMGVDPAELAEHLKVLDATEADPVLFREVVTEGARRGATTPAFKALDREAVEHRAGLVIIDNASDTFDANEVERARVRAFIRALAGMARRTDGAVLLLAHVDKSTAKASGSRQSSPEGYSGSTAWHNSARSRLFLTASGDGLTLEHQKANLATKAAPLNLVWEGGLLVPRLDSEWVAEEADLNRQQDEEDVLNAIRAAMDSGEDVPTGRTGPGTTHHVLTRYPDLPEHLRGGGGKRRFWEALARLERAGKIRREEYRSPQRKPKERYAICAGSERAGSGEASE
ncbi:MULTISPECIES: AAA family ATPase [unclassified Thioalkalivibrio]|uniref:AAA family ATPase n=1 Tax=unclassified Thioalkalivibrio TaxID=2621013 RepID=UPI001E4F3A21|nr:MULTISPECIES: AAA family ATPase [unclassified Thioalkalivibrio]